jgi:hypothetical protein
MISLFLQSLVTGLLFFITMAGLWWLLRRAAGQPLRPLGQGETLHCIRPLEISDR